MHALPPGLRRQVVAPACCPPAARKTVLMVGIMAAHALGEGCAVGVSFCGERGWAQVGISWAGQREKLCGGRPLSTRRTLPSCRFPVPTSLATPPHVADPGGQP